MAMTLQELADRASDDALALARAVLEQDVSDQRWTEQLGPALRQGDVARLLGKSSQAVSKDPRLLRVENRDGRPAYPVFQFDGRRLLPGMDKVVEAFAGVVSPLMAASWCTGSNASLGDRRPIDLLREGDQERVLVVARRFTQRMLH